MRVLILHNRYRQPGGEERLVDVMSEALEREGVECRTIVRDSGQLGNIKAGFGMLRGGINPTQVADVVAEFEPDVVHAHNIHPAFGYRALAAARQAGAKVVMHLHNFRFFCAIGTSYRDGRPCFSCQDGNTWPGIRWRCRGSLGEVLTYGYSLGAYYKSLLNSVDRFVAPSEFASEQLATMGLPTSRITVIPNPAPSDAFVEHSTASEGEYALYVGRLSSEKGADTVISASVEAGVPLVVAGDGPEVDLCRRIAQRSADVQMLGRISSEELSKLRAGAAFAVVPSRGPEMSPLAALEAMASGLPVLASRIGGLPEIVGAQQTVVPGDVSHWARAIKELWISRKSRNKLGEENLEAVRNRFNERKFAADLITLFSKLD